MTQYKGTINITTLDPKLFDNITDVSISNAFRNIGKHFESVGIGAISEVITVNSGNLYGSDVLTITSSNFSDADTVTINGVALEAKTTPTLSSQFKIASYAVGSAMNLAALINSTPTLNTLFRATASQGATESGLVTLTALAPTATSYTVSEAGSHTSWAANTLVSTAGPVSASNIFTVDASNLSAADVVVIGATTFTCEASGAVGNQFNLGASPLITAQNLAAAINAYSATSATFHAVATGTTTGICTVTVLLPGQIGNNVSVTKTAAHGVWTHTTFFTGGTDARITTLHHGL